MIEFGPQLSSNGIYQKTGHWRDPPSQFQLCASALWHWAQVELGFGMNDVFQFEGWNCPLGKPTLSGMRLRQIAVKTAMRRELVLFTPIGFSRMNSLAHCSTCSGAAARLTTHIDFQTKLYCRCCLPCRSSFLGFCWMAIQHTWNSILAILVQ